MLLALLTTIALIIPNNVEARTIRVAVIDSGVNTADLINVKRCPNLDKDFSGETLKDDLNHGTKILNLIAQGNENVDYCVAVIKIFSGKFSVFFMNKYFKALEYVLYNKFDIVNLSLNGNTKYKTEETLIKTLSDIGTIVVIAAGNDKKDLSIKCDQYPACYDRRSVIVGAVPVMGIRQDNESNYESKNTGIIDVIVSGDYYNYKTKQLSYGTSFAAPRVVSTLIRQLQVKSRNSLHFQ